jgi:SpoIID/LytB domain protein
MTDPDRTSRLLRAALALAVGATTLLAGVPASAVQTFRFNGSGWGHGIGMSQYGAFGLSQRGWSGPRIIEHYYKGASVTRRDPPKSEYRVGLLQNRGAIRVSVTRGSVALRLRSGRLIEEVPRGKSRTIIITKGRKYRIKRPNGTIVGGQTWGGTNNPLQVRRQDNAVFHVAEWGHSIGRGFLEFRIAGDANGHVVAVVPAEQYLYGLGEVPSSWPMAALVAQAIAGRTFAYRIVPAVRDGCACDILGDTRDQYYIGWDKEAGADGGRWVRAVNDSRRQVAVVGGQPIVTYYSSSSGGYTENIENVWPAASAVSYLKGVCDPGDYTTANPNRTWSVSLSGGEVASRLGGPNGMVRATGFTVGDRGVSGRVVRITVKGRNAAGAAVSYTTDGWTFRSRLGLKETRFWINQDRNVTGAIRTKYDQLGCAPKLATTKQNKHTRGVWQGFERGRIYRHNGKDTTTWIRGAVLGKYRRLRAHNGFLGAPWSYAGVAGGVRARFDGGEIYFKQGVGAYEVHGPVLRKYLAVGGVSSDLKFPISDVEALEDGSTRSRFQGGRIVCAPGGGCTVTYA